MTKILLNNKIEKCLHHLYSDSEYQAYSKKYCKDKAKRMAVIFVLGLLILFIYELIGNTNSSSEVNDNIIMRNEYGHGNRHILIDARGKDLDICTSLDIEVNASEYTYEQNEHFFNELICEFDKYIIGENLSFDYVDKRMNFVNSVDEYPFDITYETDNPIILNSKGEINYEKLREIDSDKKGVIVLVTASISNGEYVKQHMFNVRVYDRVRSADELFYDSLIKAIEEKDKQTKNKEYLELPDTVGGINVIYTEKTKNYSWLILLLTFVLMIVYNSQMDNDVIRRDEERTEQLIREYPILLNRFSLFYNAGMPIKGIWSKLCKDYENNKNGKKINAVYEEMLVSYYGMQEGKTEAEMYSDFARRCDLQKYNAFANLLCQSVSKGRSDTCEILARECEDAFNERKRIAKEKTETAGTKMLGPMFIMLLVVIVIVLYPAFASFKY